MKVRCNMCYWIGDEDSLILIETLGDGTDTITSIENEYGYIERRLPPSKTPFFFKGCPNCETDSYLTDLDEKDNN